MTKTRIRNIFLVASLITLGVAACGGTPATKTPGTPDGARISGSSGWHTDPATPLTGDLNGFFECLEAAGKTLISAHRAGSYDGYPENALETARYISAQIPALHEIDVATSRDAVLFLMHDDTLARTTTGSGKVGDMNWADISALYLKDRNGEITALHPPSLEDFLRWAKGRAIVQIDFKRSTKFEDVIDLVTRLGAQDSVIYIAYTLAQARKLHRLAPDAMISVSVPSISALNGAIATGLPTDKLLAFTGTRTPRPGLFSILNSRDIEVIFATLGGSDSIDRAIAGGSGDVSYSDLSVNGVDILATDRPLEAQAALEKTRRAVNEDMCGIMNISAQR